ncbi:signal recognition particle-docking protein FtsY [bacterium]|nr:signal recognition particle-docking protein FtsY [bacterium]
MIHWLQESLKNGDFFFYIIPGLLLILLLVAIFIPDKKKRGEKDKNELDELVDAGKKLQEESEPVEQAEETDDEEEAFKPMPAPQPEPEPASVETSPETSPEPEKPAEPEPEPASVETSPETSPEPEKPTEPEPEPEPVETSPETSPEPEKPAEPEPEPAPVETSPETSPEPEKPAEPEPEPEPEPAATIQSGLQKTRGGFISKLLGLFKSNVVTDDLIDELEEILYTADMGTTTVGWLMDLVNKNRANFKSGDDVKRFLKEQIKEVLVKNHKDFPELREKPMVFLMVGVNGAGKTTTIGKLAHKYIAKGKVPMLAAGDTFRAAAVEQLKVWGERNNCTVISDKDGADPASVAYNAVNSALSKNVDVLLIDTAGRLQNRKNLMDELGKVNRVIGKAYPGAPHETIIVIDANNGQNALSQAREFSQAVNVTGIIVTKLDGSAKGGVLIGISKELGLPIYLVGVGEKIGDLQRFDPNEFVEALFE